MTQKNSSRNAPLSIVASFIFNIFMGSVYIWSAFVPLLQSVYALSTVQTNIIFGTINITSCSSSLFIGLLLKKRSPQYIATLGALVFGIGYCIASLFHGSFFSLFIGIGIFSGFGIATGIMTALYIGAKNYPQKKGKIIGIIVSANGLGSIILAKISSFLLKAGIDALQVFGMIGICSLIILCTSARYIRVVQSDRVEIKAPNSQCYRSNPFQIALLFFSMFANSFGGFLVIGNLLPIALEANLDTTLAVTTISLFALGNMCGRFFWGVLYDRLYKKTLILALLSNALCLWMLILSPVPLAFVLITFCIGFCFGSSFSIYPAHVCTLFGEEGIRRFYPFIIIGCGLSGIIGPIVGGWSFDTFSSYLPALYIATILALIGSTITRFVQNQRATQLTS
jgi:OFA family oxalate/formate antiporter-like MFS transporter